MPEGRDYNRSVLALANHIVEYTERQMACPSGQFVMDKFVEAWLYSGLEAMR